MAKHRVKSLTGDEEKKKKEDEENKRLSSISAFLNSLGGALRGGGTLGKKRLPRR